MMTGLEKLQLVLSREFDIELLSYAPQMKIAALQELDPDFDSLCQVDLVVQLEKEYDIEIPIQTTTIKQLISILEEQGA